MTCPPDHLALFAALTPRQRQVLRLLTRGLPPKDIATTTFVSIATVRSHVAAVLSKLDVESAVAAVALAYRTGWAEADLVLAVEKVGEDLGGLVLAVPSAGSIDTPDH